jgi:aspartate/methionine/tyrosine aminotransferase
MLEPKARLRPLVAGVETSPIMQVAVAAWDIPDVVPLWFGEGDEPTPAFIRAAVTESLARGETFYTDNLGIPALRAALAAYQTRLYRRPTAVERILVTSGGMPAIAMAVQAVAGPGDRVLVVSPVWPNIRAAIRLQGAEPVDIRLTRRADGGLALDLDRLESAIDGRTRAIFVNSPSNPTGWVMTCAETEALLALARRHGLWLIADEVYARLVYDQPVAPSMLDIAEPEDRLIVVNSFSKNWAMTGWRLGWLTLPPDLPTVFRDLVQFNSSGTPTFLQRAGVTAIEEGEGFIADLRTRFAAARDLVVARLGSHPRLTLSRPEGAFYAFFRIEGVTDTLDYAKRLAIEGKVGLAPGLAFGTGGEGHLRLCFAASTGRLETGLDRLLGFLDASA